MISNFENVAIICPVYTGDDHLWKKASQWAVIFDIREEPTPYEDIRIRHNIKFFYTKEEAILHMESMGKTIRILDFEADLRYFKFCGTLRDWWQA